MYDEDDDNQEELAPAQVSINWWAWAAFAVALTTLSVILGVQLARRGVEEPVAAVPVEQTSAEERPERTEPYPPRMLDRVYSRPDGVPLTYDLVRAPDTELRPLVVLLHGGGWWRGSKNDFARDLPGLVPELVRRGFAVATISYRLACSTPERRRSAYGLRFDDPGPLCGAFLRGQLADVRASVAYFRANAWALGIDPEKVAVLGVSAGGHLALLTAATMPEGESLEAVVNWSGPPTVEFITRQVPRPGRRHDRTILASFTNAVGCAATTCPERWRQASPIRALADRKERVTAVFSIAGALETQVPPVEVAAFHAQLTKLGYRNSWNTGTGMCHGRTCGQLPLRGAGTNGLQASIAFLEATLEPPKIEPR